MPTIDEDLAKVRGICCDHCPSDCEGCAALTRIRAALAHADLGCRGYAAFLNTTALRYKLLPDTAAWLEAERLRQSGKGGA